MVADGVEQRYSFWADSPADEPRILRQFLDLAGGHPDAWLYTYGSYELDFLRRRVRPQARKKKSREFWQGPSTCCR